MSPKPTIFDPELGPLTDDLITPAYRVYQRSAGHRFSSDDVATAFVAFHARSDAKRVLDLGSGLGSVLHLLAYRLRDAELVAIEAQSASFELLRRNVERNALGARVAIHQGDLRELARADRFGKFDLVTGTPPYFPEDAAKPARDEQRTRARIETRGGVEAYIEAGMPLLETDGRLVLCGDSRARSRVEAAAAATNATILATTDVVPREGKPPLFSVWELANHREGPSRLTTLTLRDAAGMQTRDADALRTFSGFQSRFTITPEVCDVVREEIDDANP